MKLRQLFVIDRGHEEPTILLTNIPDTSHAQLLTRCAPRMLIELSDAVRFFHMDALSSAMGMKVDFDMTVPVIASGLYRLLRCRMRGYADAQARHIFRNVIDTPADVLVTDSDVRSSCAHIGLSGWDPAYSTPQSRFRGGGAIHCACRRRPLVTLLLLWHFLRAVRKYFLFVSQVEDVANLILLCLLVDEPVLEARRTLKLLASCSTRGGFNVASTRRNSNCPPYRIVWS